MTTGFLSTREFRGVFDHYAFSVFRLETLQSYAEPDEQAALRAFSTGSSPPPDPGKQEWLAAVRSARRTGRTVQRVHVVQEPLSEYLRYELSWSYSPNVTAGEDIRIVRVPPGKPWPARLRRQDFWLFDASQLYVQHYDRNGTWIGVEHDANPRHVVAACWQREAALYLGVPWLDYVRTQPQLTDALQRAS
jgi:hypothetical protein